jgi:hypothetical protein
MKRNMNRAVLDIPSLEVLNQHRNLIQSKQLDYRRRLAEKE